MILENNSDVLKKRAAEKALQYVKNNMRIGIGTGSTAENFIHLLAQKIQEGLKIFPVATSERTDSLCQKLNIKTYDLNDLTELDLTIDGADEIGPDLSLIKGGGGALLREKMVASRSKEVLIIADHTKLVSQLGHFPLPIEINIFGYIATIKAIEETLILNGLSHILKLRKKKDEIFITDGGHYIVDAFLKKISAPSKLSDLLLNLPGVIEHGLFLNIATKAFVALEDKTIKIFE